MALPDHVIHAAEAGDLDALRSSLTENSQLAFESGSSGETLLHIVSRQWPKLPNGAEAAELLLSFGADVNARDETGHTPLQCATGDLGLTRVLLEAGADPLCYSKPHLNMSPAETCLYYGCTDEAKLLVEFGALTDLRIAAGIGDLAMLQTALGNKSVGLPDQPGPTLSFEDGLLQALAYAARNGQVAAAELLLNHGADINGLCPYMNVGCTALHNAVEGGHVAMVKTLLARGARTDIPDDMHHSTPLGWAGHEGKQEIVDLLRKD